MKQTSSQRGSVEERETWKGRRGKGNLLFFLSALVLLVDCGLRLRLRLPIRAEDANFPPPPYDAADGDKNRGVGGGVGFLSLSPPPPLSLSLAEWGGDSGPGLFQGPSFVRTWERRGGTLISLRKEEGKGGRGEAALRLCRTLPTPLPLSPTPPLYLPSLSSLQEGKGEGGKRGENLARKCSSWW